MKPWMILILLSCLTVAIGAGCDQSEYVPPPVDCTPILDSLEPPVGPLEGDTFVTLRGLFVTSPVGERDVAVRVGDADALVFEVTHPGGCDACDQCINDRLLCGECERVCRGIDGWTNTVTAVWEEPTACDAFVVFITPPGEPGEAPVQLTNVHGTGAGLSFTYGDDDDSAGDDDDSAR